MKLHIPEVGQKLAEDIDVELTTRFNERLAEYTAKGLSKEDVAIVYSLVLLDMGTRIAKVCKASVLDIKERVFETYRDFDVAALRGATS